MDYMYNNGKELDIFCLCYLFVIIIIFYKDKIEDVYDLLLI